MICSQNRLHHQFCLCGQPATDYFISSLQYFIKHTVWPKHLEHEMWTFETKQSVSSGLIVCWVCLKFTCVCAITDSTMEVEKVAKVFDKKTLQDENGHYPEWMNKRAVKKQKQKLKMIKIKQRVGKATKKLKWWFVCVTIWLVCLLNGCSPCFVIIKHVTLCLPPLSLFCVHRNTSCSPLK